MNQRVEQLLAAGESRTVEFKAARHSLSDNLFETVCAFLNRDGGDILLGVEDTGIATGVDPYRLPKIKKDFANAINNPQKLMPPCHLSIEDAEYDGVMLLHIVVPPSSQVHRCKGRIYDRNEDGDYDITDHQDLVAQRYISKQNYYSENTIYPYATLADLDSEVIGKARKLAGIRQPGHPWLSMSDEELIDSAQLRQRDYQRDLKGLTLAAILLFGKDSTILSVLPHHRTDAILRRVNVDRYDDRDDIRTNLIDSYSRLLAFGEKHLNDPFYLEEDQQVSLRAWIMREIIGNLLIHREYSHAFPAKLVIESKRLFTENSNKPNVSGRIDPKLFSPFPKNPSIARVFRVIGRADELGSGVRKLYRYCKDFCGHDPVLIEDDIFRFSLSFVGSAHETQGEVADLGGGENLREGGEKTGTGGSEKTVTEPSKSLQNNNLRKKKRSEKTAAWGGEKTPGRGGRKLRQGGEKISRGSEETVTEGSEEIGEEDIKALKNNHLEKSKGSEETVTGGSEEIGEEDIKSLKNNHLEQYKESEETADGGSEETATGGSEEALEKILGLMRENASISAVKIAHTLNISRRAAEKHIVKLKATGRVKRVGPDKGGVWQVLG